MTGFMKGRPGYKAVLAFTAMLAVASSCRKNSEPVYSYFVSDEYSIAYSQPTVKSLMELAAQSYSGITGLESYVSCDVKVYKMVYKTTVGGEAIEASGLVCVPSVSGNYPLLSFQNGTNTQNAFAPSEYPDYPYYQFVETIASMGFIVVLPDYPGFGSSSQIPHPYLVAEPTVQSILDMFRAVREAAGTKIPGVALKNEYYLLGYSQGGWATLSLHKSMELDYPDEFNLSGSACGAGPYDIYDLFVDLVDTSSYSMPAYLGYIINAYSAYKQFSNPVSDILNEPYASKLSSLYTGKLSLSQINDSLTTSVPALFKSSFLKGFADSSAYSSVRQALVNNGITPWHTYKPLFLGHGESDTQVDVSTTENMYLGMIADGTGSSICKMVLYPGLDHDSAVLPCVTDGLLFLLNIRSQEDK
jgi:pimeloyl-ACP methyl ester carboxylesterase